MINPMPRLSQPKFAMDKRKMLILQTVAVLLIIVAFMLLVYEFPRYHARQGPVNGQTNNGQAQGAAVQMQSLDLKWSDKDSARSFEDLPWADDVYNVIAHGMTYKWRVHDVMPPDAAYFSVLRNPENHFKSMFHYYDVGKVLGISGKNQASKLLKNPAALTSKKGGIQNFRNITRDFGMLVILEHLSESLVLLRRVMCWRLQDILYLEKSVTQYSYKDTPMGPKQLANLRKINKIDFQLYDFFNQTLWKTIKGLGPEFLDEVKYYREVNIEVDKFCRQIETEATISKLSIPEGKWTKGFLVSQRTCEELKLEFEDWHNKFVMRRNAEVRKKESESGDEGTNEKVGKKSEQSTADILKELNAPDELPPPPGQLPPGQLPAGQLPSSPKNLPPVPLAGLPPKKLPPPPGRLSSPPRKLPPVPSDEQLPNAEIPPAQLPPPPKELEPSSKQLPPPPPQ
ncbi:PREDICTED: uncharacterized protein LOC109486481 [Branchiostoma belcheri]|uniref:Uncharacterized protein LOC109486481 n=1 Tax=Branchiostoma belcheri TaxID=7741 RepID=A0A6P4ZXG5_BRABE|nr:PREDICTED: uncharacterized protein LOC109486481 [Branchiostoma belcheri]